MSRFCLRASGLHASSSHFFHFSVISPLLLKHVYTTCPSFLSLDNNIFFTPPFIILSCFDVLHPSKATILHRFSTAAFCSSDSMCVFMTHPWLHTYGVVCKIKCISHYFVELWESFSLGWLVHLHFLLWNSSCLVLVCSFLVVLRQVFCKFLCDLIVVMVSEAPF